MLYIVWTLLYYYSRTKTFVKITFLRSSQSHFTKEHIKASFQFYWKHKDFLSNVTNTFLEYYYGFLPPLSSLGNITDTYSTTAIACASLLHTYINYLMHEIEQHGSILCTINTYVQHYNMQ